MNVDTNNHWITFELLCVFIRTNTDHTFEVIIGNNVSLMTIAKNQEIGQVLSMLLSLKERDAFASFVPFQYVLTRNGVGVLIF
jgi:hypothetical protein